MNNNKTIIWVPGKNPKPQPAQHLNILWRALLEGVRRADPEVSHILSQHKACLKLIAWNYLYYHKNKDISRELPWIDALFNQHGPTEQDISEAKAWHIKFYLLLYTLADNFPLVIRLLPQQARDTVLETNRYFENKHNIGCEVREQLKQVLRPLLTNNHQILLIGHSLGSVIAYDALWELSHLEKLPGKIDFLTLGSPLGMKYVQHRLIGNQWTAKKRYPTNIRRWTNISAVGDITALDKSFHDDFEEMLKLELLESIEDHCTGIYNFFRNELGPNFHRSYGYLVNPAVGKIIADWWQAAE